jgi:hypothetical protein
MLHVIGGSRRLVVTVVAAALLGGAALLSVLPSPASAAIHKCEETEFCLYFNADANGGYYHFAGSDRNLHNDHYVGGDTAETVANTARNVWNNGSPGPKDDVVVYGLPGWNKRGGDACIRLDTGGPLPRSWWNSIESYRWVTDAECTAAGVISF